MPHIAGHDRSQLLLLPESLDDYVGPENPVRFIEAFDWLDLAASGFVRVEPKETGRPGYMPADLLKLYIYGYLNRVRSSRRLEAEMCSTFGRDRSSAAAFRQAGQNLLRRAKPTKAAIAFLISVLAIVCGTAPNARAQVTYTYTGNPFSLAQCENGYSSTVCVNGNLQATIVFNNIPPNYSGTVQIGGGYYGAGNLSRLVTQGITSFSISSTAVGVTIASSTAQYCINQFEENYFTFVNGAITSWNIDINIPLLAPNCNSVSSDISTSNSSGTTGIGDYAEYSEATVVGRNLGNPGIWSSSATSPSPSLYLTIAPDPDNLSLTFQSTRMAAHLTLSTTPVPNSIQLPLTLPSSATTLQQAASDLGYIGFDWLQTFTAPNPHHPSVFAMIG